MRTLCKSHDNDCFALELLFQKVGLGEVIADVMAAVSEPPGDTGTMELPGVSGQPGSPEHEWGGPHPKLTEKTAPIL